MRFLPLIAVLALTAAAQIPTGPAFWTASGHRVGSAQCAACHPSEAQKFRASSMANAFEPVSRCAILAGAVHFSFTSGGYQYSIIRAGGKILYSVTDGKQTFQTALEYAFGQGKAGQTYVYSLDGKFYESRVSYYAELKGLDLTVGARNALPADLLSAAGRVMEGKEPRECFGCHTTGARIGTELQLRDYEAGVQCESCHGPGGDHVEAIRAGRPSRGLIRSLAKMDPEQTNEFCGTCHRTWEAVTLMRIKGVDTARFPAYRLTGSACFSVTDSRISCTACHDPHGPLVSNDRFYDTKCLACHASGRTSIDAKPIKVCRVGKQDCTSCHMQRVYPQDAHHAFPDHWIRVVHSRNDYPE